MPPVGSTVLDAQAIRLLTDWINEDLPQYETYDQWRVRVFAGQSGVDSGADADPDQDGANNYAEYLAHSDPLAKGSLPIAVTRDGEDVIYSFTQPAHRGLLLDSASQFSNPQWQLLESPQNRLNFPATPVERQLREKPGAPNRFHRLRLVEP
jgi:hypothetical protein